MPYDISRIRIRHIPSQARGKENDGWAPPWPRAKLRLLSFRIQVKSIGTNMIVINIISIIIP